MRRTSRLPSLIGVIHLPPLAGSPGAADLEPSASLQEAGAWAVQEARLLTRAGFEGLILENFGDTPFYRETVPPETIASMAVIAAAVRESTRLPIGINVLRNDARSALAIAAVTGCDFIRINVLSGLAATDQGLIEGNAAELLRERNRLGAPVAILADAHVKHAVTLSSTDLAQAVEEIGLRAMADGVIVTGSTTGRAIATDLLAEAAQSAKRHRIPLYIGSGATAETVGDLRKYVSGIIVGSTLRKDGRAGAPLDSQRMQAFVKAYRASRSRPARGKKKAGKKTRK